jgi:hypothetical protein
MKMNKERKVEKKPTHRSFKRRAQYGEYPFDCTLTLISGPLTAVPKHPLHHKDLVPKKVLLQYVSAEHGECPKINNTI